MKDQVDHIEKVDESQDQEVASVEAAWARCSASYHYLVLYLTFLVLERVDCLMCPIDCDDFVHCHQLVVRSVDLLRLVMDPRELMVLYCVVLRVVAQERLSVMVFVVL